eukprot:gene13492-biopygen9533
MRARNARSEACGNARSECTLGMRARNFRSNLCTPPQSTELGGGPDSLPSATEEQLRAAFREFDIDNNASIDRSELDMLLRGLGFALTKEWVDRISKLIRTRKN